METFDKELTPGNVKAAMAGTQSGDLWMVDRSKIRVIAGFNVRDKDDDYQASVREYADSMKASGYLRHKPMAGYVAQEDGENVIFITDGHTRLDAVDLAVSEGAEISKIPVVTHAKGTNMADITVALVTSNNGKPLKPQALAKVCKRLIGYGLTEAEIASRIGKTAGYVNNLLQLEAAPQAVRDMVATGKVSASLAVATIKKHGPAAAAKLTEGAVAAAASGKGKITQKAMAKPRSAPQDLLKVGVDHIRKQPVAVREYLVDMLSKLTHVSAADINETLGE